MSEKMINLDDALLDQVTGGIGMLNEGNVPKCPRCGFLLPKGSGGVMTQGANGEDVLKFACGNPDCAVKYYELAFPSLLPTGRAWDKNGKLY